MEGRKKGREKGRKKGRKKCPKGSPSDTRKIESDGNINFPKEMKNTKNGNKISICKNSFLICLFKL